MPCFTFAIIYCLRYSPGTSSVWTVHTGVHLSCCSTRRGRYADFMLHSGGSAVSSWHPFTAACNFIAWCLLACIGPAITACNQTRGEFEAAPPTRTSDRVCVVSKPCPAGTTFESMPLAAKRARVCTLVSDCKESEFTKTDSTPTSDRVCESIRRCNLQEYVRSYVLWSAFHPIRRFVGLAYAWLHVL